MIKQFLILQFMKGKSLDDSKNMYMESYRFESHLASTIQCFEVWLKVDSDKKKLYIFCELGHRIKAHNQHKTLNKSIQFERNRCEVKCNVRWTPTPRGTLDNLSDRNKVK